MITYQLNGHTRHCRSSWQEVSLEEFLQLEGMELYEKAAFLCGLSLEEQRVAIGITPLWEHALHLASTEPASMVPDFVPEKFGREAVGRIELCVKFIKASKGEVAGVYHYLYAVFAYQQEYDLLDCFVNNFPQQLADRAKALPITQVYAAIAHILAGVTQVLSRPLYAILQKEPESDQVLTNIARFEKYGFFATLTAMANGNILQLPELLQTPADVFYTWLCLDTERAEYQSDYQDLKSKKK
jgi:hypothetical protein